MKLIISLNYLIPQKLYNKLAHTSYISDEEIIRFANEIR